MQRDEGYLLDMLLAARTVHEYTAGVTDEDFSTNGMLRDAVMRQIQIIGEAARCVSKPFRDAHPEIPWQDIIGMRHRLVHHYFRIQVTLVWDTVCRDVPDLIRLLEPLVPPDEEDEA